MGESPWRIALALLLIGGMAGGAMWFLLSDGSDSRSLSSLPPEFATSLQGSTPQGSEVPIDPATTLVTVTTQPAAQQEATVLLAATNALSSWGEFAVSGDIETVVPYFVEDGPQMDQFRAEMSGLAADPAGPPSFDFLLSEPTVTISADTAVVSGNVVMSRVGETDQAFEWDLYLRLVEGEWQVWTVSEQSE